MLLAEVVAVVGDGRLIGWGVRAIEEGDELVLGVKRGPL